MIAYKKDLSPKSVRPETGVVVKQGDVVVMACVWQRPCRV